MHLTGNIDFVSQYDKTPIKYNNLE